MSLSRNPRKSSSHRQRALERRQRLEQRLVLNPPLPVPQGGYFPNLAANATCTTSMPYQINNTAATNAATLSYFLPNTTATTTTTMPWLVNNEGSGGHLH